MAAKPKRRKANESPTTPAPSDRALRNAQIAKGAMILARTFGADMAIVILLDVVAMTPVDGEIMEATLRVDSLNCAAHSDVPSELTENDSIARMLLGLGESMQANPRRFTTTVVPCAVANPKDVH